MVTLQHEIHRVAHTAAKVLITGESGVGKEVTARSIHLGGSRASNAFASVNCASLNESELSEKLQLACRGTLFLDEVCEMSLPMQGLLNRLLETGEIQRIASHAHRAKVDVRVISATN